LGATETILGHHTLDGFVDEFLGVSVHQGLPRRGLEATGVTRVVVVEILCGLVGGHDNLVCVDDDDVVTSVDVGSEVRTVLAAKQRRSDRGDTTKDETLGVKYAPLTRQLIYFWCVRTHSSSFSEILVFARPGDSLAYKT
jgi:hypothetical protein